MNIRRVHVCPNTGEYILETESGELIPYVNEEETNQQYDADLNQLEDTEHEQ